MYLKDAARVLKKNLAFIVITVATCSLVAYAATPFLKSGYSYQTVLFLKLTSPEGTESKLDATGLTDTAVSLISSGNFLNEIQVSSTVDTRKIAPQLIRLTVSASNGPTTKIDTQKIVETFNSRIPSLVQNANIELEKIGVPNEPDIHLLNPTVMAIFGAAIGILFSLMVISIAYYLKL